MNFKSFLNLDTLKVLIIDDETDICYLLSTLLKQKSFEPQFVNTLSEAEEALKAISPKIVFLDNHLPDGLGINFLEHIKQNYPDIKVVMITAHDTADARNFALKNGADLFIGKPFTRDMVYSAVDEILN